MLHDAQGETAQNFKAPDDVLKWNCIDGRRDSDTVSVSLT